VVYVGYLLYCIIVMFDVMTRLMICDIGLLCMCYIFYMPVLEAFQSVGEADKIGYFLKKILYSSIMFIDCPMNVSSVMFLGVT
jgi:hypothetical protein